MIKKLLTLAFIALAIVMAVPSLRAELDETVRPYVDDVKARFVPRRLRAMADQLDARLGRGEDLPGVFEGWLRRDFTGSPQDPWGNTYYLQADRRSYFVGSSGPDGMQGTADDIVEPARPLDGGGPRDRS
jgi:Type II secretion system (T2SS), protein G